MPAVVLKSEPVVSGGLGGGRRPDYVRMVETAYQLEISDEDWLRAVLDAVQPALDRGMGIAGWFFRVLDAGRAIEIRNSTWLGTPPGFIEACSRGTALVDPRVILHVNVDGPPCTYFYRVEDWARRSGIGMGGFQEFRTSSVPNSFTMRADLGMGEGCMIVSPRHTNAQHGPRLQAAMLRLAAHLGAAYRLRAALARPAPGFELGDRRRRSARRAGSRSGSRRRRPAARRP